MATMMHVQLQKTTLIENLASVSTFLRPKYALWDCPRPAQGSEWSQDYYNSFHATLAINEGESLLSTSSAKILSKNIGIPVCKGAAIAKSPWNAPELFDLCVLEGESLREWLFFDKSTFESENRKHRVLTCMTTWIKILNFVKQLEYLEKRRIKHLMKKHSNSSTSTLRSPELDLRSSTWTRSRNAWSHWRSD